MIELSKYVVAKFLSNSIKLIVFFLQQEADGEEEGGREKKRQGVI